MATPAIGGAEAYLRDLLSHLDRSRFEPVVFHEAWPELEEFLGLPAGIAVSTRVAVHELNGRALEARANQTSAGRRVARRVLPSRVRGRTWALMSTASDNLWAFENVRRLREAFAAADLDLLHVNNGGYPGAWTARLAPVAARLARVPATLMTVAGTPSRRRFEQPLARTLDAAVGRTVDRFIAVAERVREGLVEDFGFDAGRIVTIPYGLEDPRVDTAAARAALRARLSLEGEPTLIGLVGRVSPEKGHDVFLDALRALGGTTASRIVCLVVGDGPLLDEVRRDASTVDAAIRFLGRLEPRESLRVLAGLDVLVLPSRTEGLPYVVSEAMSLGVPVIAADVGGVPEQVVDGLTGLLVPPEAPVALAAAIARLVDDPDYAAQLGAAARQRFSQRFTLQRMLEQHHDLYSSVLR